MNNPYGIRGNIRPELKDLIDDFRHDGFHMHVEDSVFEVGFERAEDEVRAREIGEILLADWSLRNSRKVSVDFNQSWKPADNGGRHINLVLSDSIDVSDRAVTTTVNILGLAYIVKPVSDSYSFSNGLERLKKAEADESLKKALKYYSSEIIDNDRPLYGIYKALEEISKRLGGRKELAALVDKPESNVSDIMESAQLWRHARTEARLLLTDTECKQRAEILINAYVENIEITSL